QEVILVTAEGQSIRFSEEDVRSMGLAAGGVGGVKLAKKDCVIAATLVDPAGSLVTLTDEGFCKRTLLSEYSIQGRNGSGIVAHKTTAKTGQLVVAAITPADGETGHLLAVTAKGPAHILRLIDAPLMGRGVQGKQLVETGERDAVSALWFVARIPSGDDDGDDEPAVAPVKPAPPAKPVTKPMQAALEVISPRSKAPAESPKAAPTARPPEAAAKTPAAEPAPPISAINALGPGEAPATTKPTAQREPAAPNKPAATKQKKAPVPLAAPPPPQPQGRAVRTAPAPAEPSLAAPTKKAPAAEAEAPMALRFDFVDEVPSAGKKPAAKSNAKLATVTSVTKSQAGAAKKK
ncbi:MAG: hypothetical protein KAX65_03735, partial [Caldilineaceae bacterium]|nr:hypothetical protein [Caldilineaceae bacterium]